jgi:hypothetical protein
MAGACSPAGRADITGKAAAGPGRCGFVLVHDFEETVKQDMPRHASSEIRKNDMIRQRRLRMASPSRPGKHMTRDELADAVNTAMATLYPADQIAHLRVDDRWVGELERGETRWPREPRRSALRHVLGASTDADLGLVRSRATGDIVQETPSPTAHGTAFAPVLTADTPVPVRPLQRAAHRFPSGGGGVPGRGLDISTAHPARRYNYWLGGKDHFAADRESGDLIAAAFPTVAIAARENRAFLRRSVDYLARAGIRQFLDIGTGLPVTDNTHEIAQRIDPTCRVLYVDNDPLVMAHARALMCGDPRGVTDYLEADVRDPEALLAHATLTAVLDRSRPVAVLLVAVLHFLPDDEQAATVVKALLRGLPPGSHLVISNATMDFASAEDRHRYEQMFTSGHIDVRARTKAQLSRFFETLELAEPGIVAVSEWRPGPLGFRRPRPEDVAIYGAVGRVPHASAC